MTAKDLEPIFMNLNLEFVDLKDKINSLIKKYDNIEQELTKPKKNKFQCIKCNLKFESTRELEKHKKSSSACQAKFECDQCDLTYTSEMQLNRHKKKHGEFPCEKCDREYNFEGVLEKHIDVVHKSMKIFCHFYNNNKECPYEEQCIYAHEESNDCMFGNDCERIMCMFKHEEHHPDDEDSDDDDDSDEDVNDNVNENDETNESNIIQMKDLEPSLRKVEEAMEKVNELLRKNPNNLACDKCDFVAKNVNGLNMHNKSKHTKNSK